jgi:hypothetical protein
MIRNQAPVPVDPNQWPEARSFGRTYWGDPEHQARFAMALFGFRQDMREWKDEPEAAKAAETVIRTFAKHFPEFLQEGFIPEGDIDPFREPYHVDERLQRYMAGIALDATKEKD